MSVEVSITELVEQLKEIDKIPSDQWLKGLTQRKREELTFHDAHRDRTALESLDQDTFERFYGNKKYYAATAASKAYVDEWIRREAKGKIFLDYACGDGANAIKAAAAGAELAIGIDISPVSVENARRDSEAAGVDRRTYFVQADAEDTRLPNQVVDVIVCSGMLHHLDLSFALPELRRILAPKGKILAVEALDYNPAIKAYRYLTPEMRTDWEKAHILSMKDIEFARRFFEIGEVRFWHIVSLLGARIKTLMPFLETLDILLTRIPGVRLMAWIFTFEMLKREEL